MLDVINVFEDYQKSRINFVQRVAELAERPQNIEMMTNAGVMKLLSPLLVDQVPSVQQTAAIAVGRLAAYNEELARSVVAGGVLPQLVIALGDNNKFLKKAAAFVVRSVAKHSADLAQAVVSTGALDVLVPLLEEFDPSIKEGAAWALGFLAMHSESLAQAVYDAGASKLLIRMLQEPELPLKRVAAGVLSDIAKHNAELALQIVNQDALNFLIPLLDIPDVKLQRQVCACLAHMAKHNLALAERVVEKDIFPRLFACLQSKNVFTRRNSATVIREISRHTAELARQVVNLGGSKALVNFVADTKGNARLPGIMAIGYIAAFNDTLSLAFIVSNGVGPLLDALTTEPEDHIKAATVWTLGQLGRHSEDHAQALAETDAFRNIVATVNNEKSSEDLKNKANKALKSILAKCRNVKSLEPLLIDSPESVQEYVLQQLAVTLPNDREGRKAFVESGALQFVQQLSIDKPQLGNFVEKVNQCFPTEVVNYYSPEYANTLMKSLDNYTVPV